MKTINDICTELNSLASYCGGDHLTGKEIEQKLRDISDELFDIAVKTYENCLTTQVRTGISESTYMAIKRQENIAENTPNR